MNDSQKSASKFGHNVGRAFVVISIISYAIGLKLGHEYNGPIVTGGFVVGIIGLLMISFSEIPWIDIVSYWIVFITASIMLSMFTCA